MLISKLVCCDVPKEGEFKVEKPEPVLILPQGTIPEFVTEDSWLVFSRLGLVDEVLEWINLGEEFLNIESFSTFEKFVKNLNVAHDCTERKIGRFQHFVKTSQNEDQHQNVYTIHF